VAGLRAGHNYVRPLEGEAPVAGMPTLRLLKTAAPGASIVWVIR